MFPFSMSTGQRYILQNERTLPVDLISLGSHVNGATGEHFARQDIRVEVNIRSGCCVQRSAIHIKRTCSCIPVEADPDHSSA